ncbi:MAG: DUF4097 domain-containing protein [Deltaproteobacteria bacterium]|nr:DUF4097 domain-containing protein [Deltaproteobacteria bacterium]
MARIWLSGSLVAMLLVSTGLQAEQARSKSCAVSGNGEIEISNLSGSVEVIGWSREEVAVEATVGEGVKELVVSCQGSRAKVEVLLKEGSSHYKNGAADAHLTIQVPSQSLLSVETVSANIQVSEVTASAEMESVSGNVAFSGSADEVSAESVSGNVEIQGTANQLEAESVSGTVSVAEASGQLSVSSISGTVEVLGGFVTEAEIDSVSGSVTFRAELAANGELEAESHSGSVSIALPASTSAVIKASSFSGGISNDLGSEKADKGSDSRREVEFTLGGGEGRVSVETFSGSISFEDY